ncbi:MULTISPECIES: hypothetical protein [Streptosporangium]|uniref:Mce-associated membrane protein n=1 Tax=Streptosporangium brasiliense TaxID=47480 RepID=A0ABT9R1G0_9ACTN|nr:hypothetical protein [Streptosporangium brasiliense]MDP9863070.1 Mce-associated membrane protein [Streptosporangium brasiliense]
MAVKAARPPRPLRIAGPALGVLIAVLLAAAFWIGGDLRQAQATADDREAAVQAAGAHAVDLLSVSHPSVDADIKRILDTSTGPAKAEYARNLAALKETTLKDKVVQTGALRACGLVSLRGDRAQVMAVGDALIRREGSKDAPQERFYRWNMEVTKVGGVWLVSKAELVL